MPPRVLATMVTTTSYGTWLPGDLLKTRMRQALSRGRIWTEGYCHRCLYDRDGIHNARQYIARHTGCRIIAGQIVSRPLADGPE